MPCTRAARAMEYTTASQSAWKTGSFFSNLTGPKPCMPPRSWTPFMAESLPRVPRRDQPPSCPLEIREELRVEFLLVPRPHRLDRLDERGVLRGRQLDDLVLPRIELGQDVPVLGRGEPT